MSSLLNRTLTGGGIVAVFALLTPALAFANTGGQSWSSVTVNQQQSADSSHQATFNQSAQVTTTSSIGDVFVKSQASGEQSLEAHEGSQSQRVHAATKLTWDDQHPAAFTAKTDGRVTQSQDGWSSSAMDAHQTASVWQGTRQDGTWLTTADSTAHQDVLGVVGDVHQDQSISGKTKAQGFVHIPHPTCHWCSHWSPWGGSFSSRVVVTVENLFNF